MALRTGAAAGNRSILLATLKVQLYTETQAAAAFIRTINQTLPHEFDRFKPRTKIPDIQQLTSRAIQITPNKSGQLDLNV